MDSASSNYIRYGNDGTGELNLTDASYRAGGRGAKVSYTTAVSPFGPILVAATSFGACWIGVHRSSTYLESELHADLSEATITVDDGRLRQLASRVIAHIIGTADALELPLDIRATPFQLSVWREVCAIPFGATRSYGEIARRLGRRNAARAVGHANGSNPLALLIPCHRVVGAVGSLTGYRWGMECKRLLLAHERALAQSAMSFDPARPATSDLKDCAKTTAV
jgi:AraC family transcriptional regulator, regulatory protein of adaptative response / methylated-DNA-[protein]-cysteine methyltransferase